MAKQLNYWNALDGHIRIFHWCYLLDWVVIILYLSRCPSNQSWNDITSFLGAVLDIDIALLFCRNVRQKVYVRHVLNIKLSVQRHKRNLIRLDLKLRIQLHPTNYYITKGSEWLISLCISAGWSGIHCPCMPKGTLTRTVAALISQVNRWSVPG